MLRRSWKHLFLKFLSATGLGIALTALSLATGVGAAYASNNTLSGTLKDSLGNPIANATIGLGYGTYKTTTLADGTYSMTVPAGNYETDVSISSGLSSSSTVPPGNFTANSGPFVNLSTGNVTDNFTLSAALVTVNVVDSFGMPIANTPISATGDGTSSFGSAGYFSSSYFSTARSLSEYFATTNTLGQAFIYLPTGIRYSAISAYPAGNIPLTYSTLGTLTGDKSITLQEAPMQTISGIFRDAQGNPAAGAQLTLNINPYPFNSSTTSEVVATSQTTSSDGVYSLSAPAGTYYLSVSTKRTSPSSTLPPGSFSTITANNNSVDLSHGSLTQDLQFSTSAATVQFLDNGGNPIRNAPITAFSTDYINAKISPGSNSLLGKLNDSNASDILANDPHTDSNGFVTLYLPAGGTGYYIQAFQGTTSVASVEPISPLPATSSYTIRYNITGGGWSLRGTVTNPQGAVEQGVTVNVTNPTTGYIAATTVTGADGTYSTSAEAGTYNISFIPPPNSGLQTKVINGYQLYYYGSLSTVLGPTETLTGTVTNSTQSAIPNATVALATAGNDSNVIAQGLTNYNGTYTILAPAGTYDIIFSANNFRTNTQTGIVLSANSILNATLLNANSTLSGSVLTGANVGLGGVNVQIVDPNNQSNVLATTTTDNNGNYSTSVVPGIYTVIYTPAGTAYLPITQTGVNLANDATLNATMVLAPHTFSGSLKDRNGFGISGANISLHDSGNQIVTTTTSTDGSFSIGANPATYTLTISGTSALAPLAIVPEAFSLSGGAIDLTNDVHQDLSVNSVIETFTTQNAISHLVVPNVSLSVSASGPASPYTGSGAFIESSSTQTSTDSTGMKSVVLLAGSSYTLIASPPSGAGVVATTFPSVATTATDSNVSLALTAAIDHLTGTFATTAGQTGISGAVVMLRGSMGTYSAVTNSVGYYDVSAAAGAYSMSVAGIAPTSGALMPDTYSYTGGSITLSSDVQQNLTVTTTTLNIGSVSPLKTGLPGVTIRLVSTAGSMNSLYPGGTFTETAQSSGVTGANGQVPLIVDTGLRYVTTATPQSSSGYLTTSLPASNPVAAGDSGWTVTLSRDLKTVSGTITDSSGNLVQNAQVTLVSADQSDENYTAQTNDQGFYSIQAAPSNNYRVVVTGTASGSPAAILPDNYTLTGQLAVTGDAPNNITIDTVNLNIVSQDNRLAAVPNVAVAYSSTGSDNGFGVSSSTINRTTDVAGKTSLIILKGSNYTIQATPPPGIGYAYTTFTSGSPITANGQTIISFQNHVPLPTVAAGPATTSQEPTINWSAVDTAALYKIYRDNVFIGTSTNLALNLKT